MVMAQLHGRYVVALKRLAEVEADPQVSHQHELARSTDELDFVPFERTGREVLFNLLANRYERRSTIVTTGLPGGSSLTDVH